MTLEFGRRMRRVARASLLLLTGFVALASGARAERPPPSPADSLFASAYRQILEYYLDPVSLETLVLAGITKLDTADGGFAVSRVGRNILFLDHGTEFARRPIPRDDDADGWAETTAAAIAGGRMHVPELARIGDEEIYQRIFDGITGKLDRFSRYAGRDQAREQRAARDGFGGIGVTLDYSDPNPRISSVVPDGPSAKAGIEVDDRVVAIDGAPVTSLSQQELVERLRGPVDTKVWLTLNRPMRDQPFDLAVTRALIVQPTVTASHEGGIAIFRIEGFNVSTAESLQRLIDQQRAALGRSLKGVVLDLRDNPGGLLDQAADVASKFLDRGEIVSTRGRNPTAVQDFQATDEDHFRGLPLAVLVNGGSASASEIVAAALQDDGRAVVIGSSSYGKGTVQMVLRLENSGELTLTWARLYAPSGAVLHEHGVVPVFCTSLPVDPLEPPADAAVKVQRIIDAGTHPAAGVQARPRATLAEADWAQLREACPVDTRDSSLDMKVAERVLLDRRLYAQALALPGVTVAHAAGKAASGTNAALQ